MGIRRASRRQFVKFCASGVAVAGVGAKRSAHSFATVHKYERVQLTDSVNLPLKVEQLSVGVNYLFHYPYVSTPCFLVNLGKPTGQHVSLNTKDEVEYSWPGGVGSDRSIVAFSAICAHKMSHPARSVSFINYRHEDVQYRNKDFDAQARNQVIYCCSEKSVYDPANGAQVLGGPAPQPLAAILLDIDGNDNIHASGTLGGEMFDGFFARFEHRLQIEYKISNVRAAVHGKTRTVPITEFSARQMLCGAMD